MQEDYWCTHFFFLFLFFPSSLQVAIKDISRKKVCGWSMVSLTCLGHVLWSLGGCATNIRLCILYNLAQHV